MSKVSLIFFIVIVYQSSLASSLKYNIDTKATTAGFKVSFFTKKINQGGNCNLKVVDLKIFSPTPEEDGGLTLGSIEVSTELDRWQPCRTGRGPHRGQMEFKFGWSLPNVQYGSYSLILDKQLHGMVSVTPNEIKLLKE